MGNPINPKTPTSLQDFWGDALVGGFVAIPNALLHAQQELGLQSLDLLIIINVVSYWYKPESLPFPRPSLLAKRLGVTTRTVERRLQVLQSKGLVRRCDAQVNNRTRVKVREYDLGGLKEKLTPVAHGLAFVRANALTRQRKPIVDLPGVAR